MAIENFCCGAECGITVAGAGSVSKKHWNAPTGTPTVETDIVRTGDRAFKMVSAGTGVYLFRTILPASTQNKASVRFYVYFDGSLPSADCVLATFGVGAGAFPSVVFEASDSTIQAAFAATGAGGGIAVVADTWYCVDWLIDISADPRTCDVQVDGVAATQATAATAASTFSNLRLGANAITTTATATIRIDDLYVETGVAADSFTWPIGPGKVHGLSPNADGTHNFSSDGDFDVGASGTTTNFTSTDTDAHTYIDDPPVNSGDVVAVAAAAQGEYLEFQYEDLPADAITVVHVVTHVSSHRNHSSGTANRQSMRVVDGGSTAELVNNLDFSETTLVYHEAVLPTPPSGGSWDRTKVDGLRTRYAGSFSGQTHDISPVPQLFASMFEVSVDEVGGGGSAQPPRTMHQFRQRAA